MARRLRSIEESNTGQKKVAVGRSIGSRHRIGGPIGQSRSEPPQTQELNHSSSSLRNGLTDAAIRPGTGALYFYIGAKTPHKTDSSLRLAFARPNDGLPNSVLHTTIDATPSPTELVLQLATGPTSCASPYIQTCVTKRGNTTTRSPPPPKLNTES
jgi:hypothetical protein